MSPPSSDRIRQAMQLLAEEARERIDLHPLGHLLAGRGEPLDLHVAVPTSLREGRIEQMSRDAEEALQTALQELIQHTAVFQPGRIFCFRCQSAECEHAVPATGRQVFTGYRGTGAPRFQDFGQWLLHRRDPRVDLLYRDPPQLAAVVSPGSELTADLFPAFPATGYRLHGQVAVGWYLAPDLSVSGSRRPLSPVAVTLQVISSRAQEGRHRRRFGLNVIGTGPAGEPLDHLWDRLGEIPWGDAVRWAQTVLGGIEYQLAKAPRTPDKAIEARLDGLLQALGRRLEKGSRGKERRTQHAQQRHQDGDRPTRMALADLARAAPADLLVDTRRETLVVVGDRGRAHVFNQQGKLVTSVRYSPAVIEKRRQNGLWRPAAADEVKTLRERVALLENGAGGG
ncbi:MAG TPA: hypothetical protein VH988_17670 [Thermoanaerobaculia bacterium]|jgi:hypothetical protein|nr:hypothetical protein [Thermoanaerobaculia bacterium]